MDFSKNLTDFRKRKGLSQEQLAEKIGVSRQTIYTWESGAASPNVEALMALAGALDTDVEMLVRGNQVFSFPKGLPDYTIVRIGPALVDVWNDEIPGWFIRPEANQCVSWAIYDIPERRRDFAYFLESGKKIDIHGESGREIRIAEYDERRHETLKQWSLVVQSANNRLRFLALFDQSDEETKLMTFKDPSFLDAWGIGPGNVGLSTIISPAPEGFEEGKVVHWKSGAGFRFSTGEYTLTVGSRSRNVWRILSMDQGDTDSVYEQFLDREGRTLLWRRYVRNDWSQGEDQRLWDERKPDNASIHVNDERYIHWYDCVTDRFF